MAGNGFKYIISTEVNLSPASINKLVSDIRGLDQQIQKSLSVNVNARLNNNAIKTVQQQIGNTRATLSVGLKIDRRSLATFKRDIDVILANAKREIEVSLTASNRAQQVSTRNQPLDAPISSQPPRQFIRTPQQRPIPIPRLSLSASPDAVRAFSANIRQQNADTRRREVESKERESLHKSEINARRKNTAGLQQDVAQEKLNQARQESLYKRYRTQTAALRFSDVRNRVKGDPNDIQRTVLNNPNVALAQKESAIQKIVADMQKLAIETQRTVSRSMNMVVKTDSGSTVRVNLGTTKVDSSGQVISGGRLPSIKKAQSPSSQFEAVLNDPSTTMQQKQQAYAQLRTMNSQLARNLGEPIRRGYSVQHQDESGNLVRGSIPVQEWDKAGNAIDKTNKSLGQMMTGMTRHMVFQIAIVSGFVQIAQAVTQSIATMKEFESEFVNIQTLAESRQASNPNSGITADKAKEDIFGLGKLYGRDPMKDVMPVYTQILRRKDLATNEDEAKQLTQMIIRQGIVSKGNGANSEEFNTLTKDVLGVSSLMFPEWKSGGKNPMKEMNNFLNQTAVLKQHGVEVDKLMGALGDDLIPLVTREGNTGMSLTSMMSLVGAFQNNMPGTSDKESANVIKTFVTNVSKTGGKGTEEVNRILGFTGQPEVTAQQKMDAIRKRLSKGENAGNNQQLINALLTDGQFGDLAHSIASGNGSGGSARTSPYMAVMKSLNQADEFQKMLDPKIIDPHAADKLASRSVDTLSGLIGKLTASFQQLSVTIGDAGVLDAIKGFIRVVTGIVQGINYLLTPFALIHEALGSFSKDVANFASAVVASGLAVKGAVLAKNVIYGSGEGVASTMVGRIMQNTGIGAVAQNGAKASAILGANGLPLVAPTAKIASTVATTGSGVMNGVLGYLGIRSLVSGGGKGVMTGITEGFSKLLPVLISFGKLLLKLSAWGAIIGAVAWGASALYKWNESRQLQKASSFTDQLAKDPAKRQSIIDKFGEMVDLQNNDKSLLGRLGMGSSHNKIMDIRNEIIKNNPEMGYQEINHNDLRFSTTDVMGNKIDHILKFTKDDEDQLKISMDAITLGISEQEAGYQRVTHHLINQFEVLSSIKDITDRMNNAKDYNQIANSVNDIKFGSSRDNMSYISNAMNISKSTVGDTSADYETLLKRKSEFAIQSNADVKDVFIAGAALAPTDRKNIDNAFQSAQASGKLEEFYKQYTTITPSKDKAEIEKAQLAYNYASATYDQQTNQNNIKDVDAKIQEHIALLVEQTQKYKELYTQYIIASAGTNIFDAAVKNLNTTLSEAKINSLLALGEGDKIKTSAQQYGIMAKEAGLYAQEIKSVANVIATLESNNPNQDFSINALLNPSSQGLSPEQEAKLKLVDKQNELKQTFNQSLEGLRSQADAMVDLVMNTDKYKSIWDSINSRIELSKTLSGQLRDIQTQATVTPIMSQMNKKVFGQAFDSGTFNSQNAAQRRDSYMGAFEQVSKALITYGDDSNKLDQAIAQIKGDLGSQFKSLLIDPFKNIIDSNLGSAAQKQMDASILFNNSMQSLTKFVETALSKLTGNPVNDGYGVWKQTPVTPVDDGSYGVWKQPANSSSSGVGDIVETQSSARKQKPVSNTQTQTSQTTKYEDIINKAASTYDIPANLIKAVISQESSFNPNDVSKSGAMGLMQLMPGTAEDLGVKNAFNPEQNIMGGSKHLAGLLKKYNGDTTKALSAYNWGDGNLDKYLDGTKTSMPKETQDYAPSVLSKYAQYSGGNPPPVPNKADETQQLNIDAKRKLSAKTYQEELLNGVLSDHVNSLSTNGIQFALDKSIREASMKSSISGMWTDSQTGYYDSVNQARQGVGELKYQNDSSLDQYRKDLQGGTFYNPATNQQETLTASMIESYKTNIAKLEDNSKALGELGNTLKMSSYSDPRGNTTEANKQIDNVLSELNSMLGTSQVGDKKYYDDIQSLNNMVGNYFTLNKKVAVSQEAFDSKGFNYQNLGKLKQLKFDQDVKLLFDQMQGVSTELGKFAEGTNKWHVILEDAVALQEKLVGLENKKTETAKRYFELTNKSISPYINARAYTQSRDYHMASENYSSSKFNYQNNSGKMDANEQLVNFQVISESHDKMLQQMNDYRSAVVGAFKAGVMSLQEYLLKLNNLRDMNNEIKQQAVDMTSSMQDGFHSALSGALKSGMQGSFTAQQDFVSGIKDSLASSVSTQMSNIVLQQSGLQDTMNGLIGSLVGSMTTGSANGSVNAFNTNDFGKKINDALSPYLPYIQQITESTKGIFTVLKDQLFNAPGGFKIDSYLYDGAKAKGAGDIGWWQNTGGQNEAGSPYPATGSGNIVLPPMAHIPTGVPNFVSTPTEYIGSGSLNSPIVAEHINPVKAAIQGIIDMQTVYDSRRSVAGTTGNTMAHNEADLLRTALKSIPGAEAIASAIGSGLTPESMGISELQQLLNDSKLDQFDIVKNTGTMNSSLMTLISGVGAVRDAIIASITTAQGSSGTGTSGVTSPPPDYNTGLGGSTSGTSGYYAGIGALYGAAQGSSGTGTSGAITSPPTYTGGSSSPSTAPSTGVGGSFTPPASYNTGLGGSTSGSSSGYYAGLGALYGAVQKHYHSGGIIGAMNFANPNSLKPNEIGAIMKHGEIALQPKQLNNLAQGFMNGDQNINVSVDVSGAGSSGGGLADYIKVAVETAVQEFHRVTRLDNLRNKGVSY